MQDRPSQHEILDAIQRFLDEEVVPQLQGRRQFLLRVAANLLRSLDRELQQEETFAVREWQGLNALLGEEPSPDGGRAAMRAAMARRTEQLCAEIRAGAADSEPGRAAI